MIKIDHNYTDYRDDTDPKYPGGKAVNATTVESTDGTPLLADWMNDINGALQAIFIEAFGDINKVSGKPDNVRESDVLKAIKEIIKKLLPGFASQGDYTDEHPAQGVGLVKTVNRWPNAQECRKNEPWAASPNWVYNLLLGNAAENEVNNVVSQALRARVGVNDLSDKSFQFRGVISKDDLDNTVVQGSYAVTAQGYSGALLVFETHSSTGIVQFYKDGFQNEPWKYRHATDSDTQRWSEWMPFGIKLTTGTPNLLECERNTPWAASPNWVYKLLTGKAADDVNKAVTEALGDRVATELFSGASYSGISCAITINGDSVFGPGGLPVPIKGYRWSFKGEVFLKDMYICFWVIEKA